MSERKRPSYAIHFQPYTYGRQSSIVLNYHEPAIALTITPEYFIPAIRGALADQPDCEFITHSGYLIWYNRKTYANDKLEALARLVATAAFCADIDPALYSSKY